MRPLAENGPEPAFVKDAVVVSAVTVVAAAVDAAVATAVNKKFTA